MANGACTAVSAVGQSIDIRDYVNVEPRNLESQKIFVESKSYFSQHYIFAPPK